RLRAKRYANSDFMRALGDGIRDYAVKADGGRHQRHGAQHSQEPRRDLLHEQRGGHVLGQGHGIVYADVGVHRAYLAAQGSQRLIRFAGRTNVDGDGHVGPVYLFEGDVEVRLWRFVRRVVLAVLDYANHRKPLAPAVHAPADGVPAAEISAREGL